MPPLVVTMEEAKAIAQTSGALAEHYGWKPKGPTMLWINFATVMVGVYGPRVIMMAAMVKMQRASRKAPTAQPPAAPQGPDEPARTVQPGEVFGDPDAPPEMSPEQAGATMEVEGLVRG